MKIARHAVHVALFLGYTTECVAFLGTFRWFGAGKSVLKLVWGNLEVGQKVWHEGRLLPVVEP